MLKIIFCFSFISIFLILVLNYIFKKLKWVKYLPIFFIIFLILLNNLAYVKGERDFMIHGIFNFFYIEGGLIFLISWIVIDIIVIFSKKQKKLNLFRSFEIKNNTNLKIKRGLDRSSIICWFLLIIFSLLSFSPIFIRAFTFNRAKRIFFDNMVKEVDDIDFSKVIVSIPFNPQEYTNNGMLTYFNDAVIVLADNYYPPIINIIEYINNNTICGYNSCLDVYIYRFKDDLLNEIRKKCKKAGDLNFSHNKYCSHIYEDGIFFRYIYKNEEVYNLFNLGTFELKNKNDVYYFIVAKRAEYEIYIDFYEKENNQAEIIFFPNPEANFDMETIKIYNSNNKVIDMTKEGKGFLFIINEPGLYMIKRQ